MDNSLLDIPFWLANLLLASIAVIYILRKRTIVHVLVGLFGYLTFHHSYGILPLFPGIPLSWANNLHNYHGIYPTLIGVFFLVFCIIWIARNSYQHRLPIASYRASYPIVLIAVVWVLIGLAILGMQVMVSHTLPAMLAIKDFLSVGMMLLLAVAVGIGLRTESGSISAREIPFRFILLAVFIVVAVGAYEVLTEQAWSGQYLGDGVRSYRASSVLFNPNVLGIWAILLGLGSCYLWLAMPNYAVLSFFLMLLSVVGLFLSGSRSALLIYLASLAIFSGLLWVRRLRPRRLLIPVAVFSMLFVIVVAGCKLYAGDNKSNPLLLLSDRFTVVLALISPLERFAGFDVGSENRDHETAYYGVVKGIEGRVGGKTADNGYLAIYEGMGLVPMLVWICLMVVALFAGLRSYLKQSSLFGAFVITCLVNVILMGMIIRAYQVFPIWGFNAIFIGVFLFWLMRANGDSAPEETYG